MDQAQNQPPSAPLSAQTGTNWGLVLGAILAVVLIAGGVYYVLTHQNPYTAPLQEQPSTQTQGDTSDTLQNDLNASGNADISGDLSTLEQSL